MRAFILIFLFLVVIGSVNAATIHGIIYDWGTLEPTNAFVEVDSIPKQSMVAINGKYSFELNQGSYTIKAVIFGRESRLTAEENITIAREGDYVLDLILFPELVDDELINEDEFDVDTSIFEEPAVQPVLAIAIIVAGTLAIYLFTRKKREKKEIKEDKIIEEKVEEIKKEEPDLEKLVEIIKRHDGRITQKQIRKELPLSEAKVSLMISELEDKGIVKKIKKGRGNILILVKK